MPTADELGGEAVRRTAEQTTGEEAVRRTVEHYSTMNRIDF